MRNVEPLQPPGSIEEGRISTYIEEKAKVVAVFCGDRIASIPCRANYSILHQDDLKNRLICTRTS